MSLQNKIRKPLAIVLAFMMMGDVLCGAASYDTIIENYSKVANNIREFLSGVGFYSNKNLRSKQYRFNTSGSINFNGNILQFRNEEIFYLMELLQGIASQEYSKRKPPFVMVINGKKYIIDVQGYKSYFGGSRTNAYFFLTPGYLNEKPTNPSDPVIYNIRQELAATVMALRLQRSYSALDRNTVFVDSSTRQEYIVPNNARNQSILDKFGSFDRSESFTIPFADPVIITPEISKYLGFMVTIVSANGFNGLPPLVIEQRNKNDSTQISRYVFNYDRDAGKFVVSICSVYSGDRRSLVEPEVYTLVSKEMQSQSNSELLKAIQSIAEKANAAMANSSAVIQARPVASSDQN